MFIISRKSNIDLLGFYISPGAETLVSISAVSYNVTETAFNEFPPNDRNCYTNEEFQAPHLNKKNGFRLVVYFWWKSK